MLVKMNRLSNPKAQGLEEIHSIEADSESVVVTKPLCITVLKKGFFSSESVIMVKEFRRV